MTGTPRHPCNMNCMESYTETCTCECVGENHGYLLRLGAALWRAEQNEDHRNRTRLATRYEDVRLRLSGMVSCNKKASKAIPPHKLEG